MVQVFKLISELQVMMKIFYNKAQQSYYTSSFLSTPSLPPLQKCSSWFFALKGQKQSGWWPASSCRSSGYRRRDDRKEREGKEREGGVEGGGRKSAACNIPSNPN